MNIRLLYSVFFLLILFSCKKDNTQLDVQDSFEDYTGLKVGAISFYDVTYIYHDDQLDKHDTVKFKLKSVLEDTFRDNENNLRFKIHRFRWNDTIATWINYKMLSAYIRRPYYIESEDNVLVKKLLIPYSNNSSWSSNDLNTNDSLIFRYGSFYPFFKPGMVEIDSVICVKEQLYKTYVDLKRKSEYYSKNKGMVCRVYKDLKIKKGDTLNVDRGEEWYFSLYQFVKGK